MWAHFVYIHRKADTGEAFYVGKGKLKKGRPDRAYAKARRSMLWTRTVAKHGLIVELVASCIDDVAAQEIEKSLIAQHGRRDLGTGALVNLTDGGDGHCGIVLSDEARAKRSANAKKPRSKAWVTSIRKARHNGGNGGVVKKGDKLPDWWRERISDQMKGEANPMYGRTGERHPRRRAVVDVATGRTYPTVTAAAADLGLRMQTLHNMLSGFRPNSTTMRFG